MDDKNKLKKYFIKDKELTSMDEDKLNAKDVADNISLIIDSTKPPYAIAVTGQSGIGKSSVINMVAQMYKDKSDEYNVQKINVWKEETSLKELLEDTCINKEYNSSRTELEYKDSENDYNDENGSNNEDYNDYTAEDDENNVEVNGEELNTKVADNKASTKKENSALKAVLSVAKLILTFVTCFIITTIIFIFMEYLQNTEIYNMNDIFFVENTYLNYRENFLMILAFSLGLTVIAYIVNTLKRTTKNIKEEAKLKKMKKHGDSSDGADESNVEDDEIAEVFFEDVDNYADYEHDISEYRKNIIVVEDIDKLTVSKMLKALEEIKYCTEYENCIFIVPFDEMVIAKAISARNQLKISANYRPLKFEKVIDKIFEFKVYMPHISSENIKDYAVNLVDETVTNFTDEYCSMKVFEKVIRNVLVYKNVTTPRHIKKLINNFINNRVLITQRLRNGKIDKNFINSKNFDMQLAKISVLQADFEDFYDVLFKNSDYLDKLTQLYSMDSAELKNIYADIEEDLKPFLTNKYRPLMYFLRQTKNFKIENISTVMYLTKVKTEKMFKDKSLLSYILGTEDITDLKHEEVVELINAMDSSEDLREFANNNFSKLLEEYERNASDKNYFIGFNKIVNLMYNYIDEPSYVRYLEIVANNYNYYPQEAMTMFENLRTEIPVSAMNILIDRLEEGLSKDNYDRTFEFLRDNSNPFYEENGNVSGYVKFLVDNIGLASNPTEVIVELDENFTRIGKVYELNRNIKGLNNIDHDVAYKFLAKCLDNGDLDRMVTVINTILSDNESVQDCINIEEKMDNYNLIDVIECDVDDIISVENLNATNINSKKNNGVSEVNDGNADATEEGNNNGNGEGTNISEENGNSKNSNASREDYNIDNDEVSEGLNPSTIENVKLLNGNYTLLKNIIEICAIKQENVNPSDTMKIVEKALENVNDEKYLVEVYELLRKFDRAYFYEVRREFNEVIYKSFHVSMNDKLRREALECTRYFKNTHLFLTKITAEEKKFYDKN